MNYKFLSLAIVSTSLITLSLTAKSAETNSTNFFGVLISTNVRNGEDQFLLGRSYARGEGVTQSYEKAGEWYRKAADQGNIKAMNNLGILFLEGRGIQKNEAEAYKWIRMAAEKGDPRSSYLCGLLLCQGRGVTKDTTEGRTWLERASSLGNTTATERLGEDWFYGDDGFPIDKEKALPLIKKAAEAGNPRACLLMGHSTQLGQNGLPRDAKIASDWFLKSAEGGNADAMVEYGLEVIKTSPAKAYPWLKLALLRGAHNPVAEGEMFNCRTSLSTEEIKQGDQQFNEIEARIKDPKAQ